MSIANGVETISQLEPELFRYSITFNRIASSQSLLYRSSLINLIAGSFFSLNEWIFKNSSRYYFKELIENKTFPMLYWNLDELNYDDYVRRHMIGINKYLHREDFTMESNKMHVTR